MYLTRHLSRRSVPRAVGPRRLTAVCPQVWHNYGFDKHILQRRGFGIPPRAIAALPTGVPGTSYTPEEFTLTLGGFAGDTLHLARLHDAGRKGAKSYSLASLSGDPDVMAHLDAAGAARSKVSMKALFSMPKLTKTGKPSASLKELPPIHQIQAREPLCSEVEGLLCDSHAAVLQWGGGKQAVFVPHASPPACGALWAHSTTSFVLAAAERAHVRCRRRRTLPRAGSGWTTPPLTPRPPSTSTTRCATACARRTAPWTRRCARASRGALTTRSGTSTWTPCGPSARC